MFERKHLDRLLGVSALAWSLTSILATLRGAQVPAIGLSLAALHATVGIRYLEREAPRREASFGRLVLSFPAVLSGGAAMLCAPESGSWPWFAQALFVLGSAVAVLSLRTLGTSFSVLPELRSLVTRGPYGVIRHPAYSGESLMLLACCLAAPGALLGSLLVLALVAIVVRIRIEEALLAFDDGYRTYTRAVPWRLVPGLW